MYELEQQVLHTDVTGMPLEWINYQQAVRLYYAEQVAYTCGRVLYTVRGGVNARSGQRSAITVNSIIATQGGAYARLRARQDYAPPLSNAALFRRDCNTCLYCGETFPFRELSRDHIRPLVQGGGDGKRVSHWHIYPLAVCRTAICVRAGLSIVGSS